MITGVRLDRLQRGLYQVLSDELSPTLISWGRLNAPYTEMPASFISLQMIDGPFFSNWRRARGESIPEIESAVVTVEENGHGLAILRVNAFTYRVPFTTPEATRAALLAAIVEPGVSIATQGDDELLLSPGAPGGLWDVYAYGDASSQVTVSDRTLLVTRGEWITTVELQAFSKDGAPAGSAQLLAQRALQALVSMPVSDRLRFAWKLSLQEKTTIIDLSAIAGAYWESRCSASFMVSQEGVSSRPVEVIEHCQARLTFDIGGGVELPIETPFEEGT